MPNIICFIIIQMLPSVLADMRCYGTVDISILTATPRRSICPLLFNNTPCPPQNKSVIV